jgi:hypothetical protein
MYGNGITFLGLLWKSILRFGAQAKSLTGISIAGRQRGVAVGLFLSILGLFVFNRILSSYRGAGGCAD